jgi:16S rRNA (cytidine1402-2'-O)-methyltransferase
VVATPIGNMGDMTFRGVETLRTVDLVVAEDTRRARALLAHFEITGKDVARLDASASPADIERVIDRIEGGAPVAIVTDAGTPVVSDPGAALVAAARARGIAVSPIPGASALTALLSVAGFEAKATRFVGFLPRATGERDAAIAVASGSSDATVFFEAPHRMGATLEALAASLGDRVIVIGRELTKVHEEILTGGARALLASEGSREWLGELVIAIAPADRERAEASREDIERRIDEELAKGKRVKEIAALVALETGASKRDVYELAVARRGDRS